MAKPTYYEQAEVQKAQIRLSALSLAHHPDAAPEDVVRRAKAYLEFVESDNG